ncbi:hypothetical protein BB559_004452 [Furculomyces boomerangus]|uniref:Mitochondrial genome maintenance protein MGM101 n=2 Tax=Harpellales TaxID=61421 RepID=A0A2T9YEL0_9FUNG|nr:hypothetical protein BB559_004452 [Furculomyces boomerangus]PVZ97200.1 hypothetical protein BB558_006853 [Smittium angustum]PWA02714.1 hypothetical protein BB558_001140 [Smittium angustum]
MFSRFLRNSKPLEARIIGISKYSTLNNQNPKILKKASVGISKTETSVAEESNKPKDSSTSNEKAVSIDSENSFSESILAQTHQGFSNEGEWHESNQYLGVSTQPFEQRVIDILLAPIEPKDIEIKPDGLIYLPEIKYRRVLNRAFGPGGWGIVPRGPYSSNGSVLSREYALLCLGRFVSQSRGEQDYFGDQGLATATEGVKSNALMRCCKDLGIASELWDPAFISEFKKTHCISEWVTHAVKGNKKIIWRRKDRSFEYPWNKK